MCNAERSRYLTEDQHGGRNGRAAQDIVLGKAYKFDTFHLQRSNFACTDCNAKACYDRIIPLVLLLAYLKASLLYKTGVFLIKILYNLKYFVTTAFGTAPFHNWHKFIAAVF
eukprot:178617-Ditylum_brightwellii.AAC.1